MLSTHSRAKARLFHVGMMIDNCNYVNYGPKNIKMAAKSGNFSNK